MHCTSDAVYWLLRPVTAALLICQSWKPAEYEFDRESFLFHFKKDGDVFYAWASIFGGKRSARNYEVEISLEGEPGSIKLKFPVIEIDSKVKCVPADKNCLQLSAGMVESFATQADDCDFVLLDVKYNVKRVAA